MSANLNDWWAGRIVGMLGLADVDLAVLCPGNRNAPLLFELSSSTIDTVVHPEERSAAFIALGHAAITGRPAAVCTTSGSAVANLLPAVVEAHARGLPLVLLCADRPAGEIGCGAPQTMTQPGIFAAFVAAETALPTPAVGATAGMLGKLQGCLAALARGPVLINIPFDDPLPPLPDPDWITPKGPPLAAPEPPPPLPWETDPANVIPARRRLRGVIVAGPDAPVPAAWVAELSRGTGWPVVADAVSGLRDPAGPAVVTTADALLAGPLRDAGAELLVRLGAAPVARATWQWVGRQGCPVIRINREAPRRDWLHGSICGLGRPARADWEGLLAACPPAPRDWTHTWAAAEAAAAAAREAWTARGFSEATAAALALAAPAALHVVGNSLSVRHANLLAPPHRSVLANRGLAGIDGTIGTFLGALRACGGDGRLLLGDLAFLHDLPALAAMRDLPGGATIVVLDNGGGGIFDLLPLTGVPGWEELVRAPAGLDLGAVAPAFGLRLHRVEDRAAMTAALDATTDGGTHLVHVRLPAGAGGSYRILVDHLARAAGGCADG